MRNLHWFLLVATLVFCVIAYIRNPQQSIEGYRNTGVILLRMLPVLLAGFILAGQIEAFMPADTLHNWLGDESGLIGILLAGAAGLLTTGGPHLALPLAVIIFRAGGGYGPTVSYLVAWNTWGLAGTALEMGALGPRFTIIKLLATAPFPIAAGLLARYLAKFLA